MPSDSEDKDFAVVLHYLEIGRYQNAEEIMQELLASNPAHPGYLIIMANIQIQLGNLELAEEFCKGSMISEKLHEEGFHLLGIINLKRKNYAEAEKNLLESLRLNPENTEIMAKYGYLMLITGHDKKAEKLIMEALRINPDDSVVLEICFQYYLVKNKKEQQLQFLSKYLQLADNEIGKLTKVGFVELLQNNYSAAKESFVQAYLLDPTNKDLLTVIEDIDRGYHPIFFPQRMISKIGGPAVAWVCVIIIVAGLKYLGSVQAVMVILTVYILLCIYTWLTPVIYTRLLKR